MGRRKSMVWTGIAFCGLFAATGCEDPKHDLHIMAAAGAVAGWEVVLVGFFLSALLALLGKALTLPFKRGHALPMGPWLTLGFFLALLWRGTLFDRFIDRIGLFFRMLSG